MEAREQTDVEKEVASPLGRCQLWMRDTPDWQDMTPVNVKHQVRIGDVRLAVSAALQLQGLAAAIRGNVEPRDQGRRYASVLLDALSDRHLLHALEDMGGKLERVGGTWIYTVADGTERHDPDLRNLLADVRRSHDNIHRSPY